jgi:hypothetical protein
MAMIKRKVATIVAIIAILIIGAVGLSNYSLFRGNNSNTQAVSARIMDFSVNWTPLPTVVGMTSISTFNLTVENNGTVPLSGLFVSIERIANDNKTNPDSYSYPTSSDYNFSLSIAELRVIKVYIVADMRVTMEYSNSNQNFLATLTSNGTVLDERTLF